jgi:hypothetical protein
VTQVGQIKTLESEFQTNLIIQWTSWYDNRNLKKITTIAFLYTSSVRRILHENKPYSNLEFEQSTTKVDIETG